MSIVSESIHNQNLVERLSLQALFKIRDHEQDIIAIDLDGTLTNDPEGSAFPEVGSPNLQMVDLVKKLKLLEVAQLRIFTARLTSARTRDELIQLTAQENKIRDWVEKHIGFDIPFIFEKSRRIRAFIDDRAFHPALIFPPVLAPNYCLSAEELSKKMPVIMEKLEKDTACICPGWGMEVKLAECPVHGIDLVMAAPKTVPEILREGANLYEERNKTYGDSYKQFGHTMVSLFPRGLKVETVGDWNRLGVLMMAISKAQRYCANPAGHMDSAIDLSVYAAMLRELTTE